MKILDGYYDPDKHYDYTYLALGAGVQSTALLLMSNLGMVPRCDIALFADVGAEPPDVYRTLDALEKVSDIPVVRVSEGNLEEDIRRTWNREGERVSNIPAYTKEGEKTGILLRTCTDRYKIKPLEKYLKRNILGLKKYQRVKSRIQLMMGISFDEVQRMKPSRHKWCDHSYPLVDLRIRRDKCLKIIEKYGKGWPTPTRSACWFCPYHSDDTWRAMKERDDIDGLFTKACEFDELIRNPARLRSQCFLHSSRKPLKEVDFTNGGQLEFGFMGCESGHCGI